MKAIVCEKYGPPEVLQLMEIEKPTPGKNDVLIKIKATSVNAADCNLRGLTYIPKGFKTFMKLMFGFNKPRISVQGSNLAGIVEAVGSEVKTFKPGDQVFGANATRLGAYAEYACWPETGTLVHKPEALSFEEATLIPYGAHTALYFLRDRAKIKPGQKVLINGASGGVGMFAVQIARYFGAEVTGVCSASNVEFVRSLGAHYVVNYQKEDFTANGKNYDVIMDVVVGQISFAKYRNSLKPGGLYLAVAGGVGDMFTAMFSSLFCSRKLIFGTPPNRKEDLIFLTQLIEAGHLKMPIDHVFSLEQTAEAHRFFENTKRRGGVVITI